MKYGYKFKFYINARHSVNFGGTMSNIHPHTWEVVTYIDVKEEAMVNFTNFEKRLETYFDKYEGEYLNELKEFQSVNPTMEGIGNVIFKEVKRILEMVRYDLTKLEISENPTRTYIIEK